MIDFSLCRSKPWKHQRAELESYYDSEARALFWQMRTGKSKVIIDTACQLYREGKINSVVICAPNGVHDNWILRQIPEHIWEGIDYKTLCWKADTAGENAVKYKYRAWHAAFAESITFKGLTFYAFNYESVIRKDVKMLMAKIVRKRTFMAVWDEAVDCRRPCAKRTKTMRAFARYAAFRRVLDGTPVHNSPLHAFSQMELLHKACLGYAKFEDFKLHFADWEPAFRGKGLKVKNYKNLEELRDLLAPHSSVVLRKDCEDLPDVLKRERIIPLSEAQQDIYQALRDKTVLELDGKTIDIGTQCSILAKMQQVCGGFIFNKWGHALPMPGNLPRIEALLDEVTLAIGKVIVWAQYKPEIKLIAETFRKHKIKFVEYHGEISTEDRNKALDKFRGDDSVKVFIGQPQAGGRGLEILASTMVWYSHTFSGITRAQACERATKMGHTNVDLVDFIAEQGPDRYIRDKVDNAISIADDIAGRGLQKVLEELK